MTFVQVLQMLVRDKNTRQAHRADRPRRIAHVRHGRHVPAARHLEPAGPALHAGGLRPAHVLQGVEERPDPAGRASTRPAGCATGSPPRRRYSTHGVPMIPFYIFYSMFGFQRIGDLAWAAGDMRSRGFLLGGTAGRTTLNGEGLQHEDGHSHMISATVPNCISYDPTFGYEVAVIIQDGLKRMYAEQRDVLLLPDGDERELRAAGDARRRGARHHQGDVPVPGRREEIEGAARAAAGLGYDLPRGDRRRRSAARATGASNPISGAARASPSSRATACASRART